MLIVKDKTTIIKVFIKFEVKPPALEL